jgi:hypothetical protein
MEPSESNAFARAVGKGGPPSATGRKLRFAIGIALSLVLAGCLTIALFLLGALVVRGVVRGDYRAAGAAVAVIALTYVMARGGAARVRARGRSRPRSRS